MKSTRNDRKPDASTSDINSSGVRPDLGSGTQVYAANLIKSATSWREMHYKREILCCHGMKEGTNI